jgi:outer membrane lipopolysaccharide assembly protein LptE/RlpB
MKRFLRLLLLPLALIAPVTALAQQSIPKVALSAKTIAIRSDTKTGEVSDGALEQLKRWGHFTIVDDTDTADIVLRFDKKTDREKQSSQSTNDDGTTSYSGGLTFSSQVHMRAYLKGADSPFYTTKTDDSKKKAGISCVTSFQRAWNEAR